MKKIMLITILMLSLCSFGADWYVVANENSQPGDPETGTGTDIDPFIFISSAIEKASDTEVDIIYLTGTFTLIDDDGIPIDPGVATSGSKSGLQIIQKSLTFIGDNTDTEELTIIQAGASSDDTDITNRSFYIEGNSIVTFENLSIRNGRGEPSGGIFADFPPLGGRLIVNSCKIYDNIYFNDPTTNSSSGGAGICVDDGTLVIDNSVIYKNINKFREGGGIFIYPRREGRSLIINNSAIIENVTEIGNGGGIDIWTSTHNPSILIENSTISGNVATNGLGHAINIGLYQTSTYNMTINSCTIADNDSIDVDNPLSGYAIYTKGTTATSIFDIKNSIIANSNEDGSVVIENINPDPFDYITRSYTVSDDISMPIPYQSVGNINNPAEQIITDKIKNEFGTHFYKVVANSPAKDAIPKGSGLISYNGAPFIVSIENDTTWIDQRGAKVFNQKKDLGSYESPYYWIDAKVDEEYESTPYLTMTLHVADSVEFEADPTGLWDDFIHVSNGLITLTNGTEVVREEGSEFTLYDNATLITEDNVKIENGLEIGNNVGIDLSDESILTLNNTDLTIKANTNLMLGEYSELKIENFSNLFFDDGAVIELGEFSEIRVADSCNFVTNNNSAETVIFKNSESNAGLWYSIIGDKESNIEIVDTQISNAEIGVCGLASNCSITNSSFFGCETGIYLVNCSDYVIDNNGLLGIGSGIGIELIYCSDPISNNSIFNFGTGIRLLSSSATLAKNIVKNNSGNGLYITGTGSKPILVDTVNRNLATKLNNVIANNAEAQIHMNFSAGPYMTAGYNNVYSGFDDTLPSVPCIKGVIGYSPDPRPNAVLISAQENYWGYKDSIDANIEGFFFDLEHTIIKPVTDDDVIQIGYFIDYANYVLEPYTEVRLPADEPISHESTLLINAMKLEEMGNYKASINLYEKVIEDYFETPEYFVAVSRITDLYIAEERSVDPLISVFDEGIESENIYTRKFYKSQKIATFIKVKEYDEAILLAEEMLAEAEYEDEILLSEIDIAVAQMMKNSESKSKGSNIDYAERINKLLSRLTGNEDKVEPSNISEGILIPKENILYQNYPNPFNPLTQIKFALASSGEVKLSVYNISGQKVADLVNEEKNAGLHTIAFDGSKLNSGVYYYTLKSNNVTITKKMILTK